MKIQFGRLNAVLICIFVSLYSTLSIALTPASQAILNSRYRPTVTQVIRALETDPDFGRFLDKSGSQNLLHEKSSRVQSSYYSLVLDTAPGVIAALEGGFPNGMYATLGRDAFFVADVLEAFYLSLGIEGRVVRLGASSNTFSALASDEARLNFLTSNGLDIERAASGEKPFVIIDRTSYGSTSQSTRLMQAVASVYRRNPSVYSGLYGNVTVLSSQAGGHAMHSPEDAFSYRKVAAHIATSTSSLFPPPYVSMVELNGFTDFQKGVWHDTFDAELFRLPDGRLSGAPGDLEHEAYRWGTLQMFRELYALVSTESFRQSVWQAAAHWGGDLQGRLSAASTGEPSAYDQIRSMVEKDLLASLNFDSRATDAEIGLAIQSLISQRTSAWMVKIDSQGADAKKRTREARKLRKRLEEDRKAFAGPPGSSNFFFETAVDLEDADLSPENVKLMHTKKDGEERYWSPNGKILSKTFLKWPSGIDVEDIVGLLRVIEYSKSRALLTARDQRRMVLMGISHVPQINEESVKELGEEIKKMPAVLKLLVKHARVFLTSKKFVDGRARVVYLALVDGGYLPAPSACEMALEADDEE